ncbi:MAG: ferredoxin--NADP reductase [Chitinophagaceae bacterium]
MAEWLNATITKIEDVNYNTKLFYLKLSNTITFKGGQFITFDLPFGDDIPKPKRLRSYSIASAPDTTDTIELIIRYVDEGKASKFFFEVAKIGTILPFRGPLGHFCLPATAADNEIFLICTGTGIAPFRSIILGTQKDKTPHKDIYLVFGGRTEEELLFYDEMKILEKQDPNFHFCPTLSRVQWAGGPTGYVHDVYKTLSEGKLNAIFMACGYGKMVEDVKIKVIEMGFNPKQIILEKY